MADSDESEQQRAKKHINQPYDESVDVGDEEEVASIATPPPRHVEGAERARSRGDTPPEANMADDNYDDEFDTGQPDGEADYDQDPRMQQLRPQLQQQQQPSAQQPLRGMSGGGQGHGQVGGGKMYGGGDDEDDEDEDDDEDDEEDDDDDDEGSGGAIEGSHYAAHGAYDPADYEHLPVTPEIKELFQYITRYTPQTIDLEHKLKPFIPDFIPAVGDIDAFIKIPRPDGKPDTLGLTILDEPCAKQSDPTVLDLQLRAISKQTNVRAMVVKSIEDAEKNPKSVESWITSISEIHRTRPPPNVHYTKNMPDIDALMQEWPPEFEELLKEISLPTADLDCDLAQYVDMICSILDIPIYKSKIQSLHVIFTLYSEFKNSQHFKSLAADNRLDNALKGDGGGGGPLIDDSDRLIL